MSRPYAEWEPPLGRQPEETTPPRRRPLHPALLVSAAVLATALASSVGAFVFGGDEHPAAASAAARVGPRQVVGVPPTADPVNDASAGASGPATPTAAAPPVTAAAATAAPPAAPKPPKTTTKPPAPPPAKPPAGAGTEGAVLSLVNQERAKAGCGALAIDSRLAAAARGHSADMAARDFFDHDTPEGVNVATRVTNAGYKWSSVGENIAKGQQDAAAVMDSWMNSPGHRANILNCGYKHIGIGMVLAGRAPVWTQDFASPR